MKVTAPILSLLPAALAADTCVSFNGCPGCRQVAWLNFVQSSGEQVATAAGWATMTVSDSVMAFENLSGSTLLVSVIGGAYYNISPYSSCTARVPDNFNINLPAMVWERPYP